MGPDSANGKVDLETRFENEETEERRRKNEQFYKDQCAWLIYPSNKWIKIWDIIMVILLFIFAISVPYQLGVSVGYYIANNDVWFACCVAMDGLFFIDTFIHFFRVYRDKKTSKLVINKRKIRRHYLKTTFFFNLLSSAIFPSVMIRFYLNPSPKAEEILMAAYNGEVDVSDADEFLRNGATVDYRSVILVLFFYVLRMARLSNVRALLSSSSLFRGILEKEACKPHRVDLLKYSIILFLVSHWFACLWCSIVFFQTLSFGHETVYQDNWMSKWINATYAENDFKEQYLYPLGWERDLDRYVLALFWSIQTVTSIGYGNIVPSTRVEWWLSCFIMLFSAVCWALVIGSLLQVVVYLMSLKFPLSKLHEANLLTQAFYQNEENKLSESDENLRIEVTARIKRFILDKRERQSYPGACVSTLANEYAAFGSLSRELQQLSSYLILKPHLEKVPYLSSRFLDVQEQSFILYHSQFHSFGSGESIYFDTPSSNFKRGISILLEGFGLRSLSGLYDHNSSMKVGKVFGCEEVLLEESEKHRTSKVIFPTYTKMLFIPRDIIMASLQRNPNAWKNCARWKYLQFLLRHKFTRQVLHGMHPGNLEHKRDSRLLLSMLYSNPKI